MSDLVSSLLGNLTSSDVLSSLAGKAGISTEDASSVLSNALPQLVSSLQSNASSEEGAASLLNALKQHASADSLASLVENADAEDGNKILQHILGGNLSSVLSGVSEKSNVSASAVTSLLSNAAPALLTNLSNLTAEKGVDLSDGIQLSDLKGILSIANDAKKSPLKTLLGLFKGE